MNNKEKALWIARTGMLIALLIVAQLATAPLGNILVTGSMVNLLLAVSVMACGLATGLSVAVISPILAKLFGIGPLWSLIPFIITGNAVFVASWHFIGNRQIGQGRSAHMAALMVAAIAKFSALYVGIVRIAIPGLLRLPEQQAMIISAMFSVPQLITAFIGGLIATMVLPALKRAVKNGQR